MPEPDLKKSIVMSGALLAAYAAVTAWLFYQQATSWPHIGSYALLGYVILCPGIVFQAFNLAWMGLRRRLLTRGVLTRLATIPLGLVLAGTVSGKASELSVNAFKDAYKPLLAKLEARPAGACSQDPKHFQIPAIAEYNREAGREQPVGKLKHDDKRFVLAFSGSSIDMDGTTLYYDSGAKTWSHFHNNELEKAEAFKKLAEGLTECMVKP